MFRLTLEINKCGTNQLVLDKEFGRLIRTELKLHVRTWLVDMRVQVLKKKWLGLPCSFTNKELI
jgi:hypothetical protein